MEDAGARRNAERRTRQRVSTARLSVTDRHVQDAKKALATATVRQRLFHLRPVRRAAAQACC
jgi:hypothetical protein